MRIVPKTESVEVDWLAGDDIWCVVHNPNAWRYRVDAWMMFPAVISRVVLSMKGRPRYWVFQSGSMPNFIYDTEAKARHKVRALNRRDRKGR